MEHISQTLYCYYSLGSRHLLLAAWLECLVFHIVMNSLL
jgi:hypothetical protein